MSADGDAAPEDPAGRGAAVDGAAVEGQPAAEQEPRPTKGRMRAAVTLSPRGAGIPAPLARLRGRIAESTSDGTMLVLALLVGFVTGLFAVVLIEVVRLVQTFAWGDAPGVLRILLVPAAGGLVVGLVVRYYAPETGGGGIAAVMTSIALQGGRMRGRVPITKLLLSGVSLGTGASGGREGPIVQIGGGVASLVGRLIALDEERKRTLIAAGAAAGIGASRAPLTGILLAFELTSDYELVLPLMLATGIATLVADRLDAESIDTLPLTRRGIVYEEPEDIDIMQTVQVGEVMTTDPQRVDVDDKLSDLLDLFAATGNHGFPVVHDENRLVGVVTLADLRREDPDGLDHEATAGELATRQPLTVTPQDPVFRAMRRMGSLDVGRLPVVDPTDHGRLVGMVRRRDLVTAYQRAVTRSLGVQRRKDESRLRDLGGARFVELTVAEHAPAAGRAVREIDWPARTVLTAVQRRGELVLPRGDTVLEPGDAVTVLADGALAEEVRTLLRGQEQGAGGT